MRGGPKPGLDRATIQSMYLRNMGWKIPSQLLLAASEGSELVDQRLYQSAVGSLLYLSCWTRPDVTFAVSSVARFCSKPTKQHWTAVKRIMEISKWNSKSQSTIPQRWWENHWMLLRCWLGWQLERPKVDIWIHVHDEWRSCKLVQQKANQCGPIHSWGGIRGTCQCCTRGNLVKTT